MRNQVTALSKDYAQTYQALFGEVNARVDRNALAEEEAQKLIKFDVELLSRKDP